MNSRFGLFRDDDVDERVDDRRRRLKLVGLAVAVALVLGMLVDADPGLIRSSTIIPVVLAVSFLSSLVMGTVVSGARRSRSREKRKRVAEGQDMYSLIDRMMDELDEDELDYLHRRLAEREEKPKHELEQSLGDLLARREEQHEVNRRL